MSCKRGKLLSASIAPGLQIETLATSHENVNICQQQTIEVGNVLILTKYHSQPQEYVHILKTLRVFITHNFNASHKFPESFADQRQI
jgi:thiamine kinase-like enzyme